MKGQLQVSVGDGGSGGHETAILQSLKARQLGPFLRPGNTTGRHLCLLVYFQVRSELSGTGLDSRPL